MSHRDDTPRRSAGPDEGDAGADARLEHAVDAWDAPAPPEGFAEGVLAALAHPAHDGGVGVAEATAAALDVMQLDAHDDAIEPAPLGGVTDEGREPAQAPAGRITSEGESGSSGGRASRGARRESKGRSPAVSAHRRWLPWAAAALAAGLVWGAHRLPTLPSSGVVTPQSSPAGQLTEVRIADRAVAVSDADAALAWTVAFGGSTTVRQGSGRVFYRVQPGGRFVVDTPAGQIEAHGTCFEVDLLPGATLERGRDDMARIGWSQVTAGLLGAAVATVAVVSVYEGRVSVESAQGAQAAGAGERVVSAPGQAPMRMSEAADVRGEVQRLKAEKARLIAETEALREAVKEVRVVRRPQIGLDRLVEQHLDPAEREKVTRLMRHVAALEEALEDEQNIRAEREGEAFPFPPGLPQKFTENALREAFEKGLTEVGLEGEVSSIDCSEFPCIVYGEARVEAESRETMDEMFTALNESLAERYGKEDTAFNVSVWGTAEKTADGPPTHKNNFAFAMYPKDTVPEDQRDAMHTRLRHRNEQAMGKGDR